MGYWSIGNSLHRIHNPDLKNCVTCNLSREKAAVSKCLLYSPEDVCLLFTHSIMCDSLQPHGLQHASFPVLHHLPEPAQTHVN